MAGERPIEAPLASRGGLKLKAALQGLHLSVRDAVAADLGASNGGFVDVLLREGASRVYAVEKGYGLLEWRLRKDPRVVVMERTDATKVELPEPLDLVTIDVGFVPQSEIILRALALLKPSGFVLSLIKPQYEVNGRELVRGRLTEETRVRAVERVLTILRDSGSDVAATLDSPVRGSGGAQETFVLVRPRQG